MKNLLRILSKISGLRTNYKKKNVMNIVLRYKYKNTNDWVPSEEVENNPRNQDIYLLYLKNRRKFTSIAYN